MTTPQLVQATDFKDTVYRPLLQKLHRTGLSPEALDLVTSDRLSLVQTSGRSTRASTGMDKQIALLGDRFPDDPEVQTYTSLSSDIFRHVKKDPERLNRDLASLGHRGCWVAHSDLYPGQSKKPFAAMALIGRQLFVRINESAAARQITMVDGTVHNSIGLLLSSLVRALGWGKALRSSEDPMRFSRDTLAAERIIDACMVRQWGIAFGTMTFSPSDGASGLMTLRNLVQIGQAENELRMAKNAGHTLSRNREGLTHLAERSLPAGVVYARDDREKPIRQLDAYVPRFVDDQASVIEAAVQLHAKGATYLEIGELLAELEAPSRGQANLRHATFGDLVRDPTLSPAARNERLSWAARKFFTVNTHANKPWLHPDDPAADATDKLFAKAYTGKLDLWSTGRYTTLRQLGVLRGRREIAGVPVVYLGNAEVGHLPIECNWFVNDDGASTLPIDLDAATVEKSRKRLLNERKAQPIQGAGAHLRETIPWLVDQPTWTEGDYDYCSPPLDGRGQPRPTPARNLRLRYDTTSGSSLLLRARSRPAHQALKWTEEGWSEREGFGTYEGEIVFTISAAELARSAEEEASQAVGSQLDGLAEPTRVGPRSRQMLSQTIVDQRVEKARKHLARATNRVSGARQSRDEARGERDQASQDGLPVESLEAELRECDTALREARNAVAGAQAALKAAQSGTDRSPSNGAGGPVDTRLAVVAYVIAALRRLAEGDGRIARDVADLLGDHLVGWQFHKQTEGLVEWTCRLVWDVGKDEEASVELSGVVANVHLRKGRASGEFSRLKILYEGRSVDEFIATERVQRKRSGTVIGLTRHLRAVGVRQAATGPIIDHPLGEGRSYVYRRGVLHHPSPTPEGWTDLFAEHLLSVYIDPNVKVRKAAAVPQRLDPWHALQLGLLHVGGRTTTDAVAREWNVPMTALMNHLRQDSPLSLSRLNPFRTTTSEVSLQECIHADCSNRFASHLCGLPEVVATGHTAICPQCRRVPDLAWAWLVFPEVLVTTRWTRIVPIVKSATSPFGPPNPTPAPPPADNPTTLLNQQQTVEWTGSRLIVPRLDDN